MPHTVRPNVFVVLDNTDPDEEGVEVFGSYRDALSFILQKLDMMSPKDSDIMLPEPFEENTDSSTLFWTHEGRVVFTIKTRPLRSSLTSVSVYPH